MALLEKQLYIKDSTLPGVGKGLFTKKFIPKGTRIVEYQGEQLTWKEVEKMADDRNGYVFYFTAKYVLDAWNYKKAHARYINDAKGITRIDGITNNTEFVIVGKQCFVEATKNIPAFAELFVGYGAEYWQAIRYNIKLAESNKRKEEKKRLKEAAAKKKKK